jgi:hypothetical protein
MDRNNNQELTTPKPARRMDKIRRSLSFRLKKKDKHGSKSQQPSQLMLDAQLPSSASYSSGTTNNNSSAISSNFYTGSTQLHSGGAPPLGSHPLPLPTSNSTSTVSTLNNKNANSTTVIEGGAPIRPALWIEDERKVRAGNCSFQVKVSLKKANLIFILKHLGHFLIFIPEEINSM